MTQRQTIDKQLCLRLKQARKKRRYRSARAFALKHHMAVNTYLNHESGKRAISIDKLQFYADALQVPLAWLAFGEGPMELEQPPATIPKSDTASTDKQRQSVSAIQTTADENHGKSPAEKLAERAVKAWIGEE